MSDRKALRTVLIFASAVLLVSLVLPIGYSGRIVAAVLASALAVFMWLFFKKRSIPSLNKGQVLMLMTVIALVYLMLYYLSGLRFGFFRSEHPFGLSSLLLHIIPIAAITVSTELIRSVTLAEEDKLSDALCYILCVIAEVATVSAFKGGFENIMDTVAAGLFPALISNLLYTYLSRRYGILPNITYRLIISLYFYVIPYVPAMADALFAFINLIVPIIIYWFIDALFEKKRRYALAKRSRLAIPVTVVAASIMLFVIAVVSNQFYIGAYVIATPSMTGELNKGDAAIYERYDDQVITEGQVIAFEKNDRVVVHRVVEIERINGATRYYTKGDANEDIDLGYIGDSDIIGLVNFRIPYIGYPTLWLRELFDR